MSEVASNIERIYAKGVLENGYVFVANTVPPRYAIVNVGDETMWVTGPLTEEQLGIELTNTGEEKYLTDAQQHAYHAPTPFGYTIEAGEIQHTGQYPGGLERMALNIARFALGA
jgi:hypothetical protein